MREEALNPEEIRYLKAWTVPFPGSRLTYPQYLGIVYGFSFDEPGTVTARKCGLSTRNVNLYYEKLREILLSYTHAIRWEGFWDEELEEQFEDYHQARCRLHPGWRREDDEKHEQESRIRMWHDVVAQRGHWELFHQLVFSGNRVITEPFDKDRYRQEVGEINDEKPTSG